MYTCSNGVVPPTIPSVNTIVVVVVLVSGSFVTKLVG